MHQQLHESQVLARTPKGQPLGDDWLSAHEESPGLGEVSTAAAVAASHSSELPPPDSLVGFLRFPNTPAAASVSLTFAAPHMQFSLTVVGTQGTVQVSGPLRAVSADPLVNEVRMHVLGRSVTDADYFSV